MKVMINGLSSLPNSHFYDHVVPATLLQVAYGIIHNAEIAAYTDSYLGFG